MNSLAHHFIKLIKQICSKGYVTETENEMMCLLGKEKLNWSRSQIEELFFIQLHPGSLDSMPIELSDLSIDDSGAMLGMTEIQVKSIKKNATVARAANQIKLVQKPSTKRAFYITNIDKINAYNINRNHLNQEQKWFVEFKWQLIYEQFIDSVKTMMNVCLPDINMTPSFNNIIEYVYKSGKHKKKHKSVGPTRANETMGKVVSITDFSSEIIKCEKVTEEIILLLDIKSIKEVEWLNNFYATNSTLPIFWLLRSFILFSSVDRTGQIFINAVSNSPLDREHMGLAYNLTTQRIDQILINIENNMDTLFSKFIELLKITGSYNDIIVTFKQYINNTETFTSKINEEQNTSFTKEFFTLFLVKLYEEEYQLVGPTKLLWKRLFLFVNPGNDHRWQNLYIVKKGVNFQNFNKIIEYFENICYNKLYDKIIIPSNIQILFEEEFFNLINKEGLSWAVKRLAGTTRQKTYTPTHFKIDYEFNLEWMDQFTPHRDVQINALKYIFYDLELDTPMGATEIKKKYFVYGKQFETVTLEVNSISVYSSEVGIFNIANKWMTRHYVESNFHTDIFAISKANFRDAIYYHLIKNLSMQGKSLKDWAVKLNQIFNHNYGTENLSELVKDIRFKSISKPATGRTLFYYLADNFT